MKVMKRLSHQPYSLEHLLSGLEEAMFATSSLVVDFPKSFAGVQSTLSMTLVRNLQRSESGPKLSILFKAPPVACWQDGSPSLQRRISFFCSPDQSLSSCQIEEDTRGDAPSGRRWEANCAVLLSLCCLVAFPYLLLTGHYFSIGLKGRSAAYPGLMDLSLFLSISIAQLAVASKD